MQRVLPFVILCLWQVSAGAVDVLDDTASPRQQIRFQFEWVGGRGDPFEQTPAELNRMSARLDNVEVRLDTRDQMGQRAQIYLRIPEQVSGMRDSSGLTVSWNTRGRFAVGKATAGNRALLFDGVIDQPQLIEFFDFTLLMDARQLAGTLRLEPIYEIETDR